MLRLKNIVVPTLFSSILFLFSFQSTVNAQMFSVSSSSQHQTRALNMPSSFGPGLEFVTFSYYGPEAAGQPENLYNFTGTLYMAAFESDFLTFFIADRTSLGDEDNIRATRIGIGVKSPAVIAAGSDYRIAIPFGLNTDFTLVRTPETSNTNTEFAQNSGYISAGLDGLFRLSDTMRFQSITSPKFGYTVGSYGSTGGVSYKLKQDFTLSFTEIYRQYGLQLGYSLQFIRFNNTETDFRYDWTSHSVRVGVTF